MSGTNMAGLDARKKRSPIAENERPRLLRIDTGRMLRPLVGSKLCVSRERDGTLVVWSDVGDHLLRRHPLNGTGNPPTNFPLAGTRLTVVREPRGGLSVWTRMGPRLARRRDLEGSRP